MAELKNLQETNGRKIHELKILPEYYNAVRCGDKRFEIRKNDRNFHRGDILRLKEWDGEKFTGEELDALVRYVLFDWTGGLQDGYCIMSIDILTVFRARTTDVQKKDETALPLTHEATLYKDLTCPMCKNVIRDIDNINGEFDCPYCNQRLKKGNN